MRRLSVIGAVVALGLFAAACASDDSGVTAASSASPSVSAGSAASPGPELPLTAPQGATFDGFAETTLAVAAGTPFSTMVGTLTVG